METNSKDPSSCWHRGTAWADEGSTLGPDRHARDIESLDRYAMERWEVILQFMVGSPSAVSQDLAQLLVQAGLMRRYTTVFSLFDFFPRGEKRLTYSLVWTVNLCLLDILQNLRIYGRRLGNLHHLCQPHTDARVSHWGCMKLLMSFVF